MMRWIAGLAAALLLPACGGGGSSHDGRDPVGTPDDGGTSQHSSIRIISPASGATSPEGSSIVIQAEVSNPSPDIAQVDFYEDDRRIGSASSPPYILSTGALKAGAQLLCAVAVDFDGNLVVASPAVTLFVLKGDDHKH